MTATALPSPDTLRQLLEYEPESGKLIWRGRALESFTQPRFGKTWNTRFANKDAGTIGVHGYVYIEVNGSRPIRGHRIAWAMTYGYWPTMIDHINGNPADNRLSNLREVCSAENQKNQKRRAENTSGYTGVARSKSGWRAYITVDRKQVFLGVFTDIKDAVAARKSAEVRYGYHENHGR